MNNQTGEPFLSVEMVTKSFRIAANRIDVLKGVSFTAGRGEWIALTGASGSGKTTLLDIIGTISRPDSGRVLIDGTDTTALAPRKNVVFRRKKIGFVFQSYHLLPELTILENEPMSRHCSFRIGGECDAMLLPSSIAEIETVCALLAAAGEKPFLMGNGTNLLVTDAPLHRIVLRMGELVCGERIMSVAFEYGGACTQPTGKVRITIPPETLKGYRAELADGEPLRLEFTEKKAAFELDFTPGESGAPIEMQILRLIPEI